MSVTQRPIALLAAVEPDREMIQADSLPEGNVTVIEDARRNCASNVATSARGMNHCTPWPLPTACSVQGRSSPT